MKKSLIIGLVAMLPAMGVSAQEKGGKQDPSQRIETRVNTMGEKLDLSEDQKTGLKKIYEDYYATMKASREESRESMKAAREQKEEKMRELLGPEKYEAYQAMKAENKSRKGATRDGKGHPRGR